jgi:hypothetical protein
VPAVSTPRAEANGATKKRTVEVRSVQVTVRQQQGETRTSYQIGYPGGGPLEKKTPSTPAFGQEPALHRLGSPTSASSSGVAREPLTAGANDQGKTNTAPMPRPVQSAQRVAEQRSTRISAGGFTLDVKTERYPVAGRTKPVQMTTWFFGTSDSAAPPFRAVTQSKSVVPLDSPDRAWDTSTTVSMRFTPNESNFSPPTRFRMTRTVRSMRSFLEKGARPAMELFPAIAAEPYVRLERGANPLTRTTARYLVRTAVLPVRLLLPRWDLPAGKLREMAPPVDCYLAVEHADGTRTELGRHQLSRAVTKVDVELVIKPGKNVLTYSFEPRDYTTGLFGAERQIELWADDRYPLLEQLPTRPDETDLTSLLELFFPSSSR